MDSTSTCHCSNLKIRFEELSYKFCLIRKSAHSTTTFLRVSLINPTKLFSLIRVGLIYEVHYNARRGATDQTGDQSTRVDRMRRGPPTDQSSTCLFKRVITALMKRRGSHLDCPIVIQRARFKHFYNASQREHLDPSSKIRQTRYFQNGPWWTVPS